MKISDINKLEKGDTFFYRGIEARVLWKREKDDKLSVGRDDKGNDLPDKSVHLHFEVSAPQQYVSLTSRLDSKCVIDGRLYELELSDYSL